MPFGMRRSYIWHSIVVTQEAIVESDPPHHVLMFGTGAVLWSDIEHPVSDYMHESGN